MAHFALHKLNIRAGVLIGLCSANDPMNHEERVFTYGSILARVETEKEEARKAKMKGGGR